MNVLLTGERQVGKTAVCKQVAELALAAVLIVLGVSLLACP